MSTPQSTAIEANDSIDLDSDLDADSVGEVITSLADEIADLRETVEEQSARIEQLETELAETRQQAAKDRQRINDVEQDVEEAVCADASPGVEDGETTRQPDDLTPVEQLSRANDVETVSSSQSVQRAVTVFKNLADWGARTPKGIVLRPADNPVSLLGAARDESLSWRQWYRAAEALEELSQGAVTFFDSDRHGKMICLHQQSEVYDRITDESLSVSSAGATV